MPLQPLIWILIGKMKEISDYVCDDYVVSYRKDICVSYLIPSHHHVLLDSERAKVNKVKSIMCQKPSPQLSILGLLHHAHSSNVPRLA